MYWSAAATLSTRSAYRRVVMRGGLRCDIPVYRTPSAALIANARRFIESEAAGGVLLAIAADAALIISNSSLGPLYRSFIEAARRAAHRRRLAGAVEAAA